jgi:hypothetical protein
MGSMLGAQTRSGSAQALLRHAQALLGHGSPSAQVYSPLAQVKAAVAHVHRLKRNQPKGKLILSIWVFSRSLFKIMFTIKSAFFLALTLSTSTSTCALPTAQPEPSDFGLL